MTKCSWDGHHNNQQQSDSAALRNVTNGAKFIKKIKKKQCFGLGFNHNSVYPEKLI
jgi:hypothetical protein